jgi:hypothetical protein
MQLPTFSEMQAFEASALETVKRLRTINSRAFDRVTRQHLDAVELYVDAGIKQLRLLGQAQGPHDLFAGQMQLAQEYIERVVEHVRHCVQGLVSAQDDVAMLTAPAVKTEFSGSAPIAETASAAIESAGTQKKTKQQF